MFLYNFFYICSTCNYPGRKVHLHVTVLAYHEGMNTSILLEANTRFQNSLKKKMGRLWHVCVTRLRYLHFHIKSNTCIYSFRQKQNASPPLTLVCEQQSFSVNPNVIKVALIICGKGALCIENFDCLDLNIGAPSHSITSFTGLSFLRACFAQYVW